MRSNVARAGEGDAPFQAAPEDRRFRDAAWRAWPYSAFAQAQLAAEAIWDKATEALPGVGAHHMRRVSFMGRQALHAFAPTNFAWSNPLVANAVIRTGGACLVERPVQSH